MPETDPPQRPKERTAGTAIKGGKLYRHDARGGVQVIEAAWPRPRAWCRHAAGPWKALRPWVDLSACSEKHAPFSWTSVNEMDAFKDIPQEVVQAVVDAHLDRHQWASLQLAARVPGGLDLLREVPLLGAALACSWLVRPQCVQRPLRSSRALLRDGRGVKTWRRVASWLDFDGSAAFVRTLRRVVVHASRPWPVDLLRRLRRTWGHPRVRKLLLHADRLDHDVVLVAARAVDQDVAGRLHPELMAGAFNNGRRTTVPEHFLDAAGAWGLLREGCPFPVLRSPEELDALREELREEVEQQFSLEQDDEPDLFPPPPVAPRPGIHPLDSQEALHIEGQRMKNCLDQGYWSTWTRRKLGFAYAVEAGDTRAAVWLVPSRMRPGHFVVQEVRGPRNGPASAACMRLVDGWLDGHARRLSIAKDPLALVPPVWRRTWTPRVSRSLPRPLAWASDEIPF